MSHLLTLLTNTQMKKRGAGGGGPVTGPDGTSLIATYTISGAKIPANLTQFPVGLYDGNFDANAYANADDGGGDLRFTSDAEGTAQLACEIVDFDTTNSEAEVYVACDLVASTDYTIYIWGLKGESLTQPVASGTYGSDNVWDSNFVGVYHLTTDATDSTSNGRDLTGTNSPTDVTGAVSTRSGLGAQAFNGSSQDYNSSDAGFGITGDQTTSCLFYKTASSGDDGLYGKYDGGDGYFAYHIASGDTMATAERDLTGFLNLVGVVSDTTWHYYGIAIDVDTEFIGRFDATTDTGAISGGTRAVSAQDFYIGYMNSNNWRWQGYIDEFRISNINRTADWLTLEYNNTQDNANFGTSASA